mmetsp:Transcript_35163/g.80511  ORF Transcript_35163/g.80511 Transcript_35163/m.80511 type:complete len:1137 (-) Transcript_35163:63-3473(-)
MLRYDYEVEDFGKHIRAAAQSVDAAAEDELRSFLRQDIIGQDHEVKTAFGLRRVVYADYTASGRALGCVERFVQDRVLPCYGNTHSIGTATARQSTFFRSEARQVIKNYMNATHEDALIFCGSGTTAAVHKMVEILNQSKWALPTAGQAGGSTSSTFGADVSDSFLREDRWGTYECTLCGLRLKTEAMYRTHASGEMHQANLQQRQQADHVDANKGRRLVVLCDPWAHHSSMLPFRELCKRYVHVTTDPVFPDSVHTRADVADPSGIQVEVCSIQLDPQTCALDEADLVARLSTVASTEQARAICVLSAASNVTGLVADVQRLTSLIHQHGGLAFWDYAATAGHLKPDLNPPNHPDAAVDAAFFSPHKLLGGPGTVGLLVAKKRLLRNAVPSIAGGGVVFFVDEKDHSYIQNAEGREEAGTPSIVGCIRTGLVYHLHGLMPTSMVQVERKHLQRLHSRLAAHDRVDILGPSLDDTRGDRAGIVSFMIRYGNNSTTGRGLYLHYNFVSALLNDLFGVQSRGGCACAGPYGQQLLGIDSHLASTFDTCLKRSAQEILRPGFVRVSLHCTMSDQDVEVITSAIEWVADNGWQLLPAYTFCVETGEWQHRLQDPQKVRFWLSSFVPPVLLSSPLRDLETDIAARTQGEQAQPADLLADANAALTLAYKGDAAVPLKSTRCPILDAEWAHLLWFALPTDAAAVLRAGGTEPVVDVAGTCFSKPVERPDSAVFSVCRTGDVADAPEDFSTAAPPSDEGSTSGAGGEVEFGEWGCEDDDDAPSGTTFATGGFASKPRFSATALHPKVPKQLRTQVALAIKEYNMIREGDRLLVGLSGGKDSLTMLHVLLELQRRSPVKFTIAAATVNPETPEYSPDPLIEYMSALGVPYYFLCKPLIELAKCHLDPKKPSICSFCARMKRGMLYSCMREHGYNVLCLGQHLDDFAESFFMSAFRNGALRTMKANYHVQDQDLRVCRPLVKVREKVMAQFAKDNQLPVIADNCPACFSAPKERHRIKLMLSQQEFEHPDLFWSLQRCMTPLMSIECTERSLDWWRRAGGGVAGDDDDEDVAAEEGPRKRTAACAEGCNEQKMVQEVSQPTTGQGASTCVQSALSPTQAAIAGAAAGVTFGALAASFFASRSRLR